MASNRSALSYEVTERLVQMGFRREFATLVGEQMNTDFVARMMLGYLAGRKTHHHGGRGGRDAGHFGAAEAMHREEETVVGRI